MSFIKPTHRRTRLIKIAMLIAWMIVIFMLSNEISQVSHDRSLVIVDVLKSVGVHLPQDVLMFLTRKAAHIIAYFILGILMYNVVRTYKLAVGRAIMISIVCVCGYAVSDECHQIFVHGRSAEVRDVLIDTTAGTVGIGAYNVAARMKHRGKNNV